MERKRGCGLVDVSKIYLSRSDVDVMISALIDQIVKSDRNFTSVVGIANGGLHISQRVAKYLDVPHYSIRISHYDGMQHRPEAIVEYYGNLDGIKNSLIVDDLIDGGSTIQICDRVFGLEDNAVAVLFWNIEAPKPDFYVEEKPTAWIVFPWEEENADSQ